MCRGLSAARGFHGRESSGRRYRTLHILRRLCAQLRNRAALYNASVLRAFELQALGKCRIIAPDDTCGVGTLSRTKESLDALYQKGYADAAAIKTYLQTN